MFREEHYKKRCENLCFSKVDKQKNKKLTKQKGMNILLENLYIIKFMKAKVLQLDFIR